MKKLCVIFYCSGAEIEKPFKPDKFRPEWYDKKKTFKSFWNASLKAELDVYVVYDGADNSYSEFIKSHDIKDFIQVNNGNAILTVRKVYEKIYSMIDDYEHFYISEDDYLYSENAFEVLLEGINTIGGDDLFSLYDHPDRYTRTDDITAGREKITLTKSCHWRTAESTCYSFCLSQKVLRNFQQALVKPLLDRDLFRFLYHNGIRLWTPAPGVATHCCSKFMSPLVDWEKINKNISIKGHLT